MITRARVAPPLAQGAPGIAPIVALLGNPNTGKTTIFNRLCGARAKTSNFPGTTTSTRTGRSAIDGSAIEVIDLPGIYDLRLEATESEIARNVLGRTGPDRPSAVLVVVDACNLSRNLALTGELLATGLPVVVALNMVDIAQRRGLTVDTAELERRLGARVVPVMARRGDGVGGLRAAVAETLNTPRQLPPDLPPPGASIEDLSAWADDVLAASAVGDARAADDTLTERLDRAFTHPLLGIVMFVATMAGLFWTLFALAPCRWISSRPPLRRSATSRRPGCQPGRCATCSPTV